MNQRHLRLRVRPACHAVKSYFSELKGHHTRAAILQPWRSDTVSAVPWQSRSTWWASAGRSSSCVICCVDPHDSRTFARSCPVSRQSCSPTACGAWSVRDCCRVISTRSVRRAHRTRSRRVGVTSVSWWRRWRYGAGRLWVRGRVRGTERADILWSCSTTARAATSASPRILWTSQLPRPWLGAESVGPPRAGGVPRRYPQSCGAAALLGLTGKHSASSFRRRREQPRRTRESVGGSSGGPIEPCQGHERLPRP
jgi:hypothetical protein